MDKTQLQGTRDRLATLEDEHSAKLSEAECLQNHINEQTAVIIHADENLRCIPSANWQARQKIESERVTAMRTRSEIQAKLQALNQTCTEISCRIFEQREKLYRTEYEAVSAVELQERGREIIQLIGTLDSKLATIDAERNALLTKRLEAQEANAAVDEAEAELQAARAAIEEQQACGFIADRKVDLAPYSARLSKAEKRIEAAKANASAARAALPKIAERLEAIQQERTHLEAERERERLSWWTNRQRQAEAEYRAIIPGILSSLQTLVALDKFTGSRVGSQLLEGMKHGLYVPVNGKHIAEVDSRPWFGDSITPDVSQVLEAEFSDAMRIPTANKLVNH